MSTPEATRHDLAADRFIGDFSRFLDPEYKIDLRNFPGCRIVSSSEVPAGSTDGRFHSEIMRIRADSAAEISRIVEGKSRAQEIGSLPMADTTQIEIVPEENISTLSQ
jgi:hypothetical protein